MHLLFLSHRIPFPPDKGDKIRSFNVIKYLSAKGWHIHLGCLVDDPLDLSYEQDLRSYCESIFLQPISRTKQKISALARLYQNKPVSVNYFYQARLQQFVNRILADFPVQAVYCFSSPMAEYVFQAGKTTGKIIPQADRIMDLVDVDSDKWLQYAKYKKGLFRWIYGLEGRRLAAYEERIAENFDSVFLVSEAECRLLGNNVKTDNIYALGNGVDLDYFHPLPGKNDAEDGKALHLVFCGMMDYYPNVDAVIWFVRQVMPLLRKHAPEAVFKIVGARPTREVLALKSCPGVEVLGRVEDVRPHVWKADISVAPIRVARGVQNKVLEALAMAKPVVATEQAFEGIEARPGQDLLVSRASPETFAQAVLGLWQDLDRAAKIGENGRGAVEKNYAWSRKLARLSSISSLSP